MRGVKIPCELKKMNSLFEAAGFEAYLVGGAVRDEFMGKGAHDWDVATSAQPSIKLARRKAKRLARFLFRTNCRLTKSGRSCRPRRRLR